MYNTDNSNSSAKTEYKGIPTALTERAKKFGHDIRESRREGAYIFDADNKKYVDGISASGIFNLGRKNAAISNALKSAVRKTDQGNFPMISIEKANLAKKLAAFAPGDLECTVFSVIRGESIDFSCKLARGYTGKKELVYVEGSSFGQTGFALSLSDQKYKEKYGKLIPQVIKLPFGDLEAAEKLITTETAGLFIEPVQAENGCRKAGADYLKGLRDICSKTGTLLIFDETQSGMGRAGAKFACEKAGVIPDVLVIGESLGAGMFPIAATLFTQELNKFMNAHPMIHLSTFGGSDIGCLTAAAALQEYERLTPWDNAEKTGKILINGFRILMKETPDIIKSVQGDGLLIGLEFNDIDTAIAFCRNAAKNGLLVKTGEVMEESVVIRPSLLISPTDAEDILNASKLALDAL